MRWSMGQGKFGQIEDVLQASWDEFTDLLRDTSRTSYDPADKESDWWVLPALVRAEMIGVHRREQDIEVMAPWLGVDVDQGNKSLAELRVIIGPDTAMIAYTTANSTVLAQRWRVLLALDRPTEPTEYRRVWRYLARRLGGDGQTCDPTRLYYVPRQFSGDSVFYAQRGTPMRVDSILAVEPTPTYTHVSTANGSSNGMFRYAPSGTEIITSHMLQAVLGAPSGGRLYRTMCAAAKRHRLNGWYLSSAELESAAMDASMIISPGKKRPGLGREADRALRWAETVCEPESPLERMKSRILWERTKRA